MICESGNLLDMREELPSKAEHSTAVERLCSSAEGKQTLIDRMECCLEAMQIHKTYLLVS